MLQFNFLTFNKIRDNNETNIFTFGHLNRSVLKSSENKMSTRCLDRDCCFLVENLLLFQNFMNNERTRMEL